MALLAALVLALLSSFTATQAQSTGTYGALIGDFQQTNGVTGTVHAADDRTLVITNFKFGDKNIDNIFWVGKEGTPLSSGFLVPPPTRLISYTILTLPEGFRVSNLKWLAVKDSEKIILGELTIPSTLEVPKPVTLPEFSRLDHGLRSGNITVLDTKTFRIPNLFYDGFGPDAFFLAVNGSQPIERGPIFNYRKILNEVGSSDKLSKYKGETITITLPDDLTVHHMDWLVVHCIQYKHTFGFVEIPKNLHVPPHLDRQAPKAVDPGAGAPGTPKTVAPTPDSPTAVTKCYTNKDEQGNTLKTGESCISKQANAGERVIISLGFIVSIQFLLLLVSN